MPVARMRRWSVVMGLPGTVAVSRLVVADGFRDQGCLEHQFVALQYQFFVPVAAVEAERDRATLPAFALSVAEVADLAQALQARRQGLREQSREARNDGPPREIVVPARPMRLETAVDLIFAGQAEIADRDAVRRLGVSGSTLISECVELLKVSKWVAGLCFDPCRRPVCNERWANSNGPLGNAVPWRMVMAFGLPSVHGDQDGDKVGRYHICGTRWTRFLLWRSCQVETSSSVNSSRKRHRHRASDTNS